MFQKYPFVRQTDQSECGAAALAMIALYYRVPIGLQKVRNLAGTDRVGTNLQGLLQAAERLGFSAKGVKGCYETLCNIPLPAIAHVMTEEGFGHFVVLYRIRSQSVVVADPRYGIQQLPREAFCRCWTGYLLLLVSEGTRDYVATGNQPLKPWRRFLGLLRLHRSILVKAFFCALLMTLLGISSSYFVQHLVDSVLVLNEGRLLNTLGIGMVLIVLFRSLFGALRQYLLAHVGRKVDLSLISGYVRHILDLPMQFFESRRVGEILSRVNDTTKVRDAISGTTLTALVDGVLVAISMSVFWLYDIQLALVATLFVTSLLTSVVVHHPACRQRSNEAMENAAQLSAYLVEDISGVETVKTYQMQQFRSEEGEARLVKLTQSIFSLEKLGISMNVLGTFVTGIAGIAVLWYGGHRVMNGVLTTGQLIFCYTLLGYMLEPLGRLASVNLKIQDALVAVDRLSQIMDLEVESWGENKARFDGINHQIDFQEVCVRYGGRKPVLERVNLKILAGSTVAIIGESGSGKSTLLKLLMRLYDPTEGRILIDGVDMQDFDLKSLRNRIGFVSQEPFIFNGTIQENIALGRPETTMIEVIEASRLAKLEEFIAGLPERYDTVIGERGANLSGGQRQRLAIARALLKKPEILIFDEATSHLDTSTELAIQKSVKTALKGKTVVLVAHRLSTIREADIIYVLREGKIMEQGTHGQLIAQEGWYSNLWNSQTEGRRDLARPQLRAWRCWG